MSSAKWQSDCFGLNELDLNWHSTGPYPLNYKNTVNILVSIGTRSGTVQWW